MRPKKEEKHFKTSKEREVVHKAREARTAKKYKFNETMELQTTLKHFDDKKDTRFKANVVLPIKPKNIRIVFLADAADCQKCEKAGIPLASQSKDYKERTKNSVEYEVFESLNTRFDKSKPGPIKQWAKLYDKILVSKAQSKNILKVFGPHLNKAKKEPIPIDPSEDLASKFDELQRTVEVRAKVAKAKGGSKVVHGYNWAIGKVTDRPEDLYRNVMLLMNTFADNINKGWHNVKSAYLHTTMGPSKRIH